MTPAHDFSARLGWVVDPTDSRAHVVNAEPRHPNFPQGGWLCAGAMGFYGFDVPFHLIALPFYVARDGGDLRHCCYCVACAEKYLGVTL